MRIDSTRYKAFRDNPERYRLAYELNWAPSKLGYGLQRGTVFHTFMDEWGKSCPDERIRQHLKKDGMGDDAISKGEAMARALRQKYEGTNLKTLLVEKEFEYAIPGSPHSMVGRIDHILDYDGQIMVGDFKTASAKTKLEQKKKEWLYDPQVDFYLLGAKTLGYETDQFLVRTITETVPVNIWEIPTSRTQYQLALTQRFVHIICETITLWRNTFGIEEPWPHWNNFPCDLEGGCGGSYCDFKNVCGTTITADTPMPSEFVLREEHLEIMKETIQ